MLFKHFEGWHARNGPRGRPEKFNEEKGKNRSLDCGKLSSGRKGDLSAWRLKRLFVTGIVRMFAAF
jgi:hypothetical protein